MVMVGCCYVVQQFCYFVVLICFVFFFCDGYCRIFGQAWLVVIWIGIFEYCYCVFVFVGLYFLVVEYVFWFFWCFQLVRQYKVFVYFGVCGRQYLELCWFIFDVCRFYVVFGIVVQFLLFLFKKCMGFYGVVECCWFSFYCFILG